MKALRMLYSQNIKAQIKMPKWKYRCLLYHQKTRVKHGNDFLCMIFLAVMMVWKEGNKKQRNIIIQHLLPSSWSSMHRVVYNTNGKGVGFVYSRAFIFPSSFFPGLFTNHSFYFTFFSFTHSTTLFSFVSHREARIDQKRILFCSYIYKPYLIYMLPFITTNASLYKLQRKILHLFSFSLCYFFLLCQFYRKI